MTSNAASWHIPWTKGTLSGAHPKSKISYVNALKLRFQDRDARDEADEDMEKVRYEGCIRYMFTKIQTFNDKAMVTGAALKMMILQRLPQKIDEQMNTVDLPGKTDQEIITIITNAGRIAEKWEAARKNLGLESSLRNYEKKHHKLERPSNKPERSEQRKFERDRKERKRFKYDWSEKKSQRDNSNTDGIEATEIESRKSAGECLRCMWPSDRKGSHRVKDCIRPIKLDKGTASYPKAKEYQKMKIAGMELSSGDEESSDQSESSDSSGSEEENSEEEESEEEGSEGEYLDEEEDSENDAQQEEEQGNWWDLPEVSDKSSHIKLAGRKLMF
jgi:hypothetical protein